MFDDTGAFQLPHTRRQLALVMMLENHESRVRYQIRIPQKIEDGIVGLGVGVGRIDKHEIHAGAAGVEPFDGCDGVVRENLGGASKFDTSERSGTG